jgi:DNA segregation ATPase FtsK/SpoIIIE, S-DNA-T family
VLRVVRSRRSNGSGLPALPADDLAGWRAWCADLAGRPGAVLLDDAGPLADSPVGTALAAGDRGDGEVLVLAAGTAGELGTAFRGPIAELRRGRSGVLLSPGPGDADLLGVRLPRTPVPVRPGSGWLVTAGAPQRVQVARRAAP